MSVTLGQIAMSTSLRNLAKPSPPRSSATVCAHTAKYGNSHRMNYSRLATSPAAMAPVSCTTKPRRSRGNEGARHGELRNF